MGEKNDCFMAYMVTVVLTQFTKYKFTDLYLFLALTSSRLPHWMCVCVSLKHRTSRLQQQQKIALLSFRFLILWFFFSFIPESHDVMSGIRPEKRGAFQPKVSKTKNKNKLDKVRMFLFIFGSESKLQWKCGACTFQISSIHCESSSAATCNIWAIAAI